MNMFACDLDLNLWLEVEVNTNCNKAWAHDQLWSNQKNSPSKPEFAKCVLASKKRWGEPVNEEHWDCSEDDLSDGHEDVANICVKINLCVLCIVMMVWTMILVLSFSSSLQHSLPSPLSSSLSSLPQRWWPHRRRQHWSHRTVGETGQPAFKTKYLKTKKTFRTI